MTRTTTKSAEDCFRAFGFLWSLRAFTSFPATILDGHQSPSSHLDSRCKTPLAARLHNQCATQLELMYAKQYNTVRNTLTLLLIETKPPKAPRPQTQDPRPSTVGSQPSEPARAILLPGLSLHQHPPFHMGCRVWGAWGAGVYGGLGM